ncbi:MAG: DUF4178 domain-containing protein [Burkholderiales bacterium]|nr:DUF4178 domain-containing protein [Burkholderiales bacterium]
MAPTQRAYRAACPNCGAAVEFASAASASAVCSYCRSTLVRDGDALRRIGVSAELFDDFSPLQLGAGGRRQGIAFTLVGRLQYGTAGGTWNEWHALFDNGRSAWLSEDNGAYVMAFDAPLPADAPQLDTLRAGARTLADGRAWDVASVVLARLIAAEGELPRPPRLQGQFTVVDLRNSAGEVATLDDSDPKAIAWSVGRSVALAELALQGLKDASEKTLAARGVTCPSCGAALEVKLATTQSVTCGQCNAVVDVSGGVGADLAHYQQNNAGAAGAEPQLALGRSGTLALGGAALPWEVVGYQERCTIPQPGDDETEYWREYLLYNRTEGFAFLVDSNEGWSWVKPITGVPQLRGDHALCNGVDFRKRWDYAAQVTWVQGEFYWRVRRDERAQVTDYMGSGAQAGARLSRERSGDEVTWSAGWTLDASAVADAFGIAPAARAALQRDAAPLSSGSGMRKAFWIFVVIVVILVLMSECSGDGCSDIKKTFGAASNEYRQCEARRGAGSIGGIATGGGSFGGYSSGGGGHK